MVSGASDPFSGRRWGDWIVVRRLAVGGMAEIFEARAAEPRDGAPARVALKVVLPQHADDPEFRSMLAAEASLQGRLSHPNLVRVLGHGEAEGRPFLALELVDGPSLAEVLKALAKAGRTCPPPVAMFVGTELLRALAYVHEAVDEAGNPLRIVHRDVNPPNVLLERTGRVRLGDFGIARSSGRETRTHTGVIKGKLRYLAPEQVTGSRLDSRTDIFAAGLVLWEILAGEPHLQGESEIELMRGAEAPSYRPLAGRPGLDARFDRLLSRSLQRFPEERWGSARSFLEALDRLRGEPGLAAGAEELAALLGELRDSGGIATAARDEGRRSALRPADVAQGRQAQGRPVAGRAVGPGAGPGGRAVASPPGRTTWRIPPTPESSGRGRRRGLVVAAGVLAAAVAVVAGWWVLREERPEAADEGRAAPDTSAAAAPDAPVSDASSLLADVVPPSSPPVAVDGATASASPEAGNNEAAPSLEDSAATPGEVTPPMAADAPPAPDDGEADAPPVASPDGATSDGRVAPRDTVTVDARTGTAPDGARTPDAGPTRQEDGSSEAAVAAEAVAGPAVDADVGATSGPDPAEVRGRLERARGELRGRGVLLEDLPAALRADLRAADEALVEGRPAEAEAALDELLPRLAAIRVDGPFVRAKLERVEAALSAASDAGRDVADLRDLAATGLQDYLQGRYDATNRTLNDILGRLAAGGGSP
ncbi:MAG: serine/threonine protein kinase [Acidobacteria bacterium]|nr:serine/threonine protein kinase [Acidobacteriota bacterium]